MRRTLVMLLPLLPGIALGQGARLETTDPEPRVVSSATRTAHISPNRVTFYITIEGSGESAAEAAQRATQKLQSVSSAVQPFASSRDAITTVPYGVSPAPSLNGYPGSSSQTSFVARYVIRVQPSRLDQITPLAAAAIAAGASAASPPTFESTATDSVRRQLYVDALSQARRDAEALATALGGHLGAVFEVSSTGGNNQGGIAGYLNFMTRYELNGPVQAPEVLVSATVTVRYRFVP